MIAEIFIGIITNALYDAGKFWFESTKSKKADVKKELRDYVVENLDGNGFESLFGDDYSVFESYMQSPQVSDFIRGYLFYCATGHQSEEIKQYIAKRRIRSITENDVVKYLANNLVSRYSSIKLPLNNALLESFFKRFFEIVKKYFFDRLAPEEQFMLFSTNDAIMKSSSAVYDKVEMLINAMNFPIVQRQEDFEETRSIYMNAMRDNYNKAHIYLSGEFMFGAFYIPPILRGDKEYMDSGKESFFGEDNITWENIFNENNIVYAIGGAGYGKSLFLKNIILNYTALNINDSANHIVVYGDLKTFLNPDGSFKTMTEFLETCIRNDTGLDISKEFVQYYLSAGRCIILLDALDEVPKEKRVELHKMIIANLKTQNPNNKICITSRDRGFIPAEKIKHFKIKPLNRAQIIAYVDRMSALGEFKADKEDFIKQSEKLIKIGFLKSFLILSLLIKIYKSELEFPENKLELYEKCFSYIAQKREFKRLINFDWDKIRPIMKENTFTVLSQLCYPNNKAVLRGEIEDALMQEYEKTFLDKASEENAIAELLRFCGDRTELFVPASQEDSFKFFHRSFFEYFYAQYIYANYHTVEGIYNQLKKFDVDAEIFELTLSNYKQKSQRLYTGILDFTIEQAERELSESDPVFGALNILILFMQIVTEEPYKEKLVSLLCKHKRVIADQWSRLNIFGLVNGGKMESSQFALSVSFGEEQANRILTEYSREAKREIVDFFATMRTDIWEKILQREISSSVLNNALKGMLLFYSLLYLNRYSIDTIIGESDMKELVKVGDVKGQEKKSNLSMIVKSYRALSEDEKATVAEAFHISI